MLNRSNHQTGSVYSYSKSDEPEVTFPGAIEGIATAPPPPHLFGPLRQALGCWSTMVPRGTRTVLRVTAVGK